jgi:hypothetical protein
VIGVSDHENVGDPPKREPARSSEFDRFADLTSGSYVAPRATYAKLAPASRRSGGPHELDASDRRAGFRCWVGTLLFLAPMFVFALATIPIAWLMFHERRKRRAG